MHDQLSSLARETSSEKRRELMGEVADIFVSGSADYSDRELFLFGEVLTKLLDNVDSAGRAHLSRTIASVEQTPRDLALSLANDDIAIALPILEKSPVLTEQDLVAVVNSKETDHRLAISKRTNLSATITDALIGHGEQPVLHSVGGNKSAKISDEGFNKLVDHAENDNVLSERLSHRTDMPVEVMKRVAPLLPPVTRQKLFNLIESQGETALGEIVGEAERQAKDAVMDNKRERLAARVLLKDVRDGNRELGPVIEGLCEEDRPLDVGLLLAGISGFPEKYVASSLMNMNGKAIAVLCRTLELSDKAFAAIAAMRCQRFQLPSSMATRLSQEFADIDMVTAQRTLRFSKVRGMAV